MILVASQKIARQNVLRRRTAAGANAVLLLLSERGRRTDLFVLYILVTPLSWPLPATLRPVALRPHLSAGLPFTVDPNMQNRLSKDQAAAAHILEQSADA